MFALLRIFKFSNKFSDDLIKVIKLLYVFGDLSSDDDVLPKNIFFITLDDEFFSFGSNISAQLGLGHRNPIEEPTKVNQLCSKNIVNISHGLRHVLALNKSSEVYCWGSNQFGQLGKGSRDTHFHKPEKISFLSDKFVINICCGQHFSLALTKNGEVYAWGCNDQGQIGNKNENLYQLLPVKINSFIGQNIVAISCGNWHSLALTEIGTVYSWGSNRSNQLGVCHNKLIDTLNEPHKISNENNLIFNKLCCGSSHSLILSKNEELYTFGQNFYGQLGIGTRDSKSVPTICLKNIKEIASSKSCEISLAISKHDKRDVTLVWGKCGSEIVSTPTETEFDLLDYIFAYYEQITNKPVFSDNFNDNFDNLMLLNERYKSEFTELCLIGKGSYGSVFKAQHQLDKQLYAVKKIHLNSELIFV
jgi:alpha-tubulin suppressor-like RCC1 family protein